MQDANIIICYLVAILRKVVYSKTANENGGAYASRKKTGAAQ